MKHIQQGYQGLSVFIGLQMDRVLSVVAIGAAIALASYIGQV